MSIELSAENDRYLQQVVQEGIYPSLAQAANEAVELLKRRDQIEGGIEVHRVIDGARDIDSLLE